MSYYIRPRQDLTLATFSKIIFGLHAEHIAASFTLAIDPDNLKTETRICIEDDSVVYDDLVKNLAKYADITPNYFRQIRRSKE